MVERVEKRDGSIVDFDKERITDAVKAAFDATGEGGKEDALEISDIITDKIKKQFEHEIPSVEDIQDIVEETLIEEGYNQTSKAYILYRKKREVIRKAKTRGVGTHVKLKHFSLNAIKVLTDRYLQRDEEGRIIETPDGLFKRVAKSVAEADLEYGKNEDEVEALSERFYEYMFDQKFMPNSPTLFNAGTGTDLTLSACFLIPVEDDLGEIFDALKEMALVQKAGGGTGFSFSKLRPEGDIVKSTGGVASGPLSFMKVFNSATETIKQGGKRRGANMGVLRVDHPDIMDFITAKEQEGPLNNFNISVGATDEFMDAVESDDTYTLINPRNGEETDEINARKIFDLITTGAWRNGEPGMIWLDTINRDNPVPNLGTIKGTNPCGELPLLPYESCNLGHINLEKFVEGEEILWDELEEAVKMGGHFLDNVITINKYPIEEIKEATEKTRKIGLGVMGFANLLYQLRVPYDSEKALEIAENLMGFISEKAMEKSKELADDRGGFPAWEGSIYSDEGVRVRNATRTVIAPTGTTSIISDASPSIEPIFALVYRKTEVLGGTSLEMVNQHLIKALENEGIYSEELMEKIMEEGSVQDLEEIPDGIKEVFKTALEIHPEWHVKMQAAFQKHVDNSVSKTINMQHDASPKDVSDAYMLPYKLGCKGITVYRYGSREKEVLERGEGIECEVCG